MGVSISLICLYPQVIIVVVAAVVGGGGWSFVPQNF